MLKTLFRHIPKAALVGLTLAGTILATAIGASAQTPPKPEAAKEAPPPGDAEAGAEQFEAICAECHGAAATAPTLRGVINRPVASEKSFYGYSEALKAKSSETWTTANLFAYLKSPAAFAPGSFMYREFPDPKMRADIIAFLATLPPPRD